MLNHNRRLAHCHHSNLQIRQIGKQVKQSRFPFFASAITLTYPGTGLAIWGRGRVERCSRGQKVVCSCTKNDLRCGTSWQACRQRTQVRPQCRPHSRPSSIFSAGCDSIPRSRQRTASSCASARAVGRRGVACFNHAVVLLRRCL